LTLDAYQLQDIICFYLKTTKSFIYHYNLNNHEDSFIFDTNLMEQVNNFISTNYAHENLLWDESTKCHNNFIVVNRKIIRKLKFNLHSIAIGIARTTSILPIVRANYFCYTFE